MNEEGSFIVFQTNRIDGIGGWDIWNYDRSGGRVGTGYSSGSDDIEPQLRWQ